MEVFDAYHKALGELIFRFDATIDHRAGDGMMVVCDDPARKAVELALAMRDRMAELQAGRRRRGHELGFAVGVSYGYATMGMLGYEGRYHYMANGSVDVLAARLRHEAEAGQVVVSQRVVGVLEGQVDAEPLGEFALKGLPRPTAAYNVVGLKTGATAAAAPGNGG